MSFFQIGIWRSTSGLREAGCRICSASISLVSALSILLRNRKRGMFEVFQLAQDELQLRHLLLVGLADHHRGIDRGQRRAHVVDELDRARAIDEGVAVAHERRWWRRRAPRSSCDGAPPWRRRRRWCRPPPCPGAGSRRCAPGSLRAAWSFRSGRGPPARCTGDPGLLCRHCHSQLPSTPPCWRRTAGDLRPHFVTPDLIVSGDCGAGKRRDMPPRSHQAKCGCARSCSACAAPARRAKAGMMSRAKRRSCSRAAEHGQQDIGHAGAAQRFELLGKSRRACRRARWPRSRRACRRRTARASRPCRRAARDTSTVRCVCTPPRASAPLGLRLVVGDMKLARDRDLHRIERQARG